MTNAMWRYENGACGTLLHSTALHEGEFSVELAIIADGWLLRLVDPYNVSPKLFVRRPGHVEEEVQLGEVDIIPHFCSWICANRQDDCYFSEISTIVDVIEGRKDKSAILSPFEDAIQSYKLVSTAKDPRSRKDLGHSMERRRELQSPIAMMGIG